MVGLLLRLFDKHLKSVQACELLAWLEGQESEAVC